MVTPEKIERINILAKKSKTIGLTDEEKEEQKKLREEYLEGFRQNFRGQLDRIKFVEDENETENVENTTLKS